LCIKGWVIKWPVRFFTFFTFFSKSKKHDFLRIFELLHTFSSRTLVGGVVQTFPSNRPWKGISKSGFKILRAPSNIFGGRLKLVPNFVIFRLFRPFLHKLRQQDITNLKTDCQTTDTSLRYGEKNGVLWSTMKYVIAAHSHPPCGRRYRILTRRSGVELIF